MSANNWAVCPRCEHHADLEVADAHRDALVAYGKVPVEQYEKLKQEALDLQARKREKTFAEYYHQGVSPDGKYTVSYSGSCRACGLEFAYRHEQQVPLVDEP